jgi:hypothetical protein
VVGSGRGQEVELSSGFRCSLVCLASRALQAVIMNKAMSLIVVMTALPARPASRPF